jgi:hypothetical protein
MLLSVTTPPTLLGRPPIGKATFILNVNPGQDPSDGPNYYNFDDRVRYSINIDNNRDGKADDIVYEFRFRTDDRPVGGRNGLTSQVPYLGNPHIPSWFPLRGVTALNGAGSEGLTRRQLYTVTEIRNGVRRTLFDGRPLIALPSNAGPATFPNYPALAAQGIFTDPATGVRVFAGQRAETFYIDPGAVFDMLNLRRSLPALTAAGQDADNVNPFGVNRFSGANVSAIAIEVPITRLTRDGKPADASADPVIGVYAETTRRRTHDFDNQADDDDDVRPGDAQNYGRSSWVCVSRMANPLVNELILTTPKKDAWNASNPEDEAQFQSFYKNPVIATALNLVFGAPIVPINDSLAANRTDLMGILLKYPGQALAGTNCVSPCSELLRLDLRVPPTARPVRSKRRRFLSTAIATALMRFCALSRVARAPENLSVSYRLLAEVDPQHRGLLRLVAGDMTRSAIFAPDAARQTFSIAQESRWRQFVDYLFAGVDHIWNGYDHILFLLLLLLPAAVAFDGGRWTARE